MAYVLYHSNCPDGFGAAWAVKTAITIPGQEDKDHYLPCAYGQPMPSVPDGQDIVIVDFSYPEETLRSLARRSRTVTLLDHHKTAEHDLRGLLAHSEPNMEVTFDMNHSGAYLAWDHFHAGKMPLLIRYLEDRDLWRKQLPYHEEVIAWMQSYERTFENLDWMAKELVATNLGMSDAVLEGSAILRFKSAKVNEICEQASLQSLGGYDTIPVVNATAFMSEVANRLLELYPEAPFAAYYMDRKDKQRQWGLRSRKDFDCSVVAKAKGGGGHAQASGFEEKL